MQKYHSTFIGIPLPEEFMDQFQGLIASLKLLDIGLKTVNPNTPPHVTVYYLGDQSAGALEEAWGRIEPYSAELAGIFLSVNGMGTFGEQFPRVLFLKVNYPPELEKFANMAEQELHHYQKNEHETFRPHLTLARLYNHHSKKLFVERRGEIEERLDKINWSFPITKLVLYGIPEDDGERHHVPIFEVTI